MRTLSSGFSASSAIHNEDFIYRFLLTNPATEQNATTYYFEDGHRSAVTLKHLINRYTNLSTADDLSLLEFASGYGCVTRHLPVVMPTVTMTACDIHEKAVDFIENSLAIRSVISTSRPEHFRLGRTFDIVFALSFFSHMPETSWGAWLEALFRHVSPGGYLIFTTHGNVTRDKLYPDLQLHDDGFWFSSTSEQGDLDGSEYGTSITTPEYVTQQIYRRLQAPLALFSQGSWWGHQDTYIVARPVDLPKLSRANTGSVASTLGVEFGGMQGVSASEALSWMRQVLAGYRARGLIMTISPDDDMHNSADPIATDRYIYVGFNALEVILDALFLVRKIDIKSVLDMPCGFGRVLRHLRSAFPDAALHACDLYDNRLSFCSDTLGAVGIKSKEQLAYLTFPQEYDLIWCGSLLTHLPRELFAEALRLLCRSLAAGGIAIVTLHGRYTPINQRYGLKYLADDLFIPAEREFYRSGFGFADYRAPDVYAEQRHYGVSIATPSYVLRLLEEDETVSIVGYRERAWDDHQDVLIIQKKAVNHSWSWPSTG
jgi:SAM-dependent methyltransferase